MVKTFNNLLFQNQKSYDLDFWHATFKFYKVCYNDDPGLTSAEVLDDCMSKFTSLVRARYLFPPVTAPGVGVSPVNYSDSDSSCRLVLILSLKKLSHKNWLNSSLKMVSRYPRYKLQFSMIYHMSHLFKGNIIDNAQIAKKSTN